MTFVEAKDAILSFLAAGGIYWLGSELHKMRNSVETLNVRMAEMLQRSMHHEKQLEKHENRISSLEKRDN